jgi:hypothetical protein
VGEIAQPMPATSSRAAKSARITPPNSTSSVSVIVVGGRNDVAMMNRTVTIYRMPAGHSGSGLPPVSRLRRGVERSSGMWQTTCCHFHCSRAIIASDGWRR